MNVLSAIRGGVVALQVTRVSFSQSQKTRWPKLVTVLGIVMVGRLLQLEKAPSSMLTTPSGIKMEVSFRHSPKAHSPIEVTLSGNTTDVKLKHA
jgi:hypothetical protein